MAKKMLIDATHPEETRVVVVDGSRIEEFDYESVNKIQISGNIYLAKVTRVEPSLQAAFVDYGGNRHGFLAFAEIHPDYYQIPVADREALIAAQRAAEADADAEEDANEQEAKRGSRRRRTRGKRRDDENGTTPEAPRAPKGRVALAPLSAEAAPDARALDAAEALSWVRTGPALPDWESLPEELKAPPELQPERTQSADEETPGEDASTGAEAAAPDLSDVSEIEIRRESAPDEAEALGADLVVERITLDADGEVTSREISGDARPERAGAEAFDVVRAEAAPAGGTDESAAIEDAETTDETAADADEVEEEDEVEIARADRDTDENDRDDDDRPASADIEEVGADDARDEIRPRQIRVRDYKIQEVIKKRQIMLVQVVKEERGSKGAALTTYISLAGRYCVLMPNTARGGGISRKITNAADRKRLKEVANELEVPEGMGLIVRTAGANRTKSEIKRDYEYLLRQWSAVRELTLRSIAPALIYEEGSLIKRAIRDLYNKDIDAVLVEGEDGYREAKDYMKMLMPSHAKNVQPYRDRTPLFIRHQVESQMTAMMNPTVQLKSGGYLVIGVTEALVAIDVNSGRSTKESSIEETALKTNLEAAEEVARQLRLRDLAGLVVIDFIDMEESKNNKAVEKRLKERLKTDRARIQVGRISGFGLLEMSRQRLRPGLLEANTVTCPHCKGAGVIRSDESMALAILRAIEEEGVRGKAAALRLAAPVAVANYLVNLKRAKIATIEARYDVQVLIDADPSLVSPDFNLDRTKPILREEPERTEAVQIEAGFADHDLDDAELLDEDEDEEDAGVEPERAERTDESREDERDEANGRRRRRRRKRSDESEKDLDAAVEADAGDGSDDDQVGDADSDEGDDDGRAGRKRRGRRGGRRRKARNGEDGDPLPVIDLDDDVDAGAAQASETAADTATVEAEATAEAETDADAERADADAENAAESDVKQATDDPAEADEAPAPVSEAPKLVVTEGGASEPPDEASAAADGDVAVLTPLAEAAAPVKATPVKKERRRTGWWNIGRGA